MGISIKLLSDAKMLNSMAGQTTLTAAFIDDVFSLVLLVLLSSLAADADDAALVITLRTIAAFAFLGAGVYGGAHLLPMLDKPLGRIPFVRGASIQPRDEVRVRVRVRVRDRVGVTVACTPETTRTTVHPIRHNAH